MLVLGVVILGSFTFMTLTRTPLPRGAHLHHVPHRRRDAAGRAGLEPAQRRRPRRVLLPLPVLDRPAGGEVAALPRRAAAGRGAARSASWARRWRRCCALPSVAGRALARRARRAASRAAAPPHAVDYASSELALTIFSRYRLGPTLHWHLHLLGQLLGEFYVAKLREEKLRQASYLQAVHETGARMTHDIKNLLQSLSVLTSVAARDDGHGLGAAAGAAAPPAAADRAAPGRDAGQAAAPAGRRRALRRRAPLVGSRSRASTAARAWSSSRRRRRRACACRARCSTAWPTT